MNCFRLRLLVLAFSLSASLLAGCSAGPAHRSSTATSLGLPAPPVTDGQAFLRDAAARTWAYVSGPGTDAATGLPRDFVAISGAPSAHVTVVPATDDEYTNPAVIGMYLSAIAAAKDVGVLPADQASNDAGAVVDRIRRMAKYRGFLYRWYSTADGSPIPTPHGEDGVPGEVSSVDNGWLAQGLLVVQGAFPELASTCQALLGAMQWQMFYDQADNVLYNGYRPGTGVTKATYDNAYSGPRIAYDMAIGSGKVPGSLWWGPHRTPPADHKQRQAPQGQDVTYTDPQNHRPYPVFEGHYVYRGIDAVPTFDGSLFQALGPDLVIPEQASAPASLGANDHDTALAQAEYASAKHLPIWGWAPATSPDSRMKYTNYGMPDLAIDQGTVSDAAVAPYAAFLALPVLPDQAYTNIRTLIGRFPDAYTQFGFLDSVNPRTGSIAGRFMAASQSSILMAIDDSLNHGMLQDYVATSPYLKVLTPYMQMEKYSVSQE